MAASASPTIICSVLCLDIVDFSPRPVAEQWRLKKQFDSALTEAIAGVATRDRIVLDAGGGAAVSFLANPEQALLAGVLVRGALAAQATTSDGPRFPVRIGINLGPVVLVRDINGQLTVIGDGIQVAKSMMTFAEPGQILVSRSYHDVIVLLRVFESHPNLFSYLGTKMDTNLREHEVYAAPAIGSDSIRPILESGEVFRRHSTQTGRPERKGCVELRLFGVPILFHWSFALMGLGMGLFVGSLFFGTSAALAVQAFIWTTASLVTLVVAHGLGHALAAKAFSMEVNAIITANDSCLCLMGAFPSARAALIVGASGLLVQFVLFTITLTLLSLFGAPTTLPLKCVVIVYTGGNVFLMALNLLPYGARDGARIIQALRAIWAGR